MAMGVEMIVSFAAKDGGEPAPASGRPCIEQSGPGPATPAGAADCGVGGERKGNVSAISALRFLHNAV